MDKTISVYFQDASGTDIPAGTLQTRSLRGKEIFSFEASTQWIERSLFRFLDPDLGQFTGPQYLRDEKPNFGLFLDSSPDRWGRILMRRRESLLARQEDRQPRTLRESDYLLGVFDGNRMGALRFGNDQSPRFLDDNATLAAPPLAQLRQLQQASLHLEGDDVETSSQYEKWLMMLVAPGSSLGGARPKANVVDPTGELWIAKFPSARDRVDQGAWEVVAATLARRCGIAVADFQAQRFGREGTSFLSKRFDRRRTRRIHFASAMTLLGRTDGTDAGSGASYLDMVEFLLRHGGTVERDLRELWTRIAFSVLISNTDDHLRNHGFLLGPNGWALSPAYDLNPNPEGAGLTLNISENDNALDTSLVLDVAPHFRVPLADAKQTLATMERILSRWRELAKESGIPRREQDEMAPAFRV